MPLLWNLADAVRQTLAPDANAGQAHRPGTLLVRHDKDTDRLVREAASLTKQQFCGSCEDGRTSMSGSFRCVRRQRNCRIPVVG